MNTVTVNNKRFIEIQPVGYFTLLQLNDGSQPKKPAGLWLMSMVAQSTMIGDGFLVVPDESIAVTRKGDDMAKCYGKVRICVFDAVSLIATVFAPNMHPSPIYIWQEEDDIDLLHLDLLKPDDEADNMLPIDQATDKMPPEPEDEFDDWINDFDIPF